jgi:hypothetical protein
MQSEQIAAPRSPRVDSRVAALRRIAVVPALNEEDSIASVISEIRAADPGFEVIVVDDGSKDRTAQVAAAAGAHVVRLPYNLGIGGAVQTGLQYARDHPLYRRSGRRSSALPGRDDAARADRRGPRRPRRR